MIKFFKDGLEVNKIDFGETDVGTSNVLNIGIKNEYSNRVKLLYPKSSDPDVKIIELPDSLNPQETRQMVISFEPSIFRRKPLDLSDIGFRVVM